MASNDESLEIKIELEAQSALNSLDKLATKLERVQSDIQSLEEGKDLSGLSTGFSVNMVDEGNLRELMDAISEAKKVRADFSKLDNSFQIDFTDFDGIIRAIDEGKLQLSDKFKQSLQSVRDTLDANNGQVRELWDAFADIANVNVRGRNIAGKERLNPSALRQIDAVQSGLDNSLESKSISAENHQRLSQSLKQLRTLVPDEFHKALKELDEILSNPDISLSEGDSKSLSKLSRELRKAQDRGVIELASNIGKGIENFDFDKLASMSLGDMSGVEMDIARKAAEHSQRGNDKLYRTLQKIIVQVGADVDETMEKELLSKLDYWRIRHREEYARIASGQDQGGNAAKAIGLFDMVSQSGGTADAVENAIPRSREELEQVLDNILEKSGASVTTAVYEEFIEKLQEWEKTSVDQFDQILNGGSGAFEAARQLGLTDNAFRPKHFVKGDTLDSSYASMFGASGSFSGFNPATASTSFVTNSKAIENAEKLLNVFEELQQASISLTSNNVDGFLEGTTLELGNDVDVNRVKELLNLRAKLIHEFKDTDVNFFDIDGTLKSIDDKTTTFTKKEAKKYKQMFGSWTNEQKAMFYSLLDISDVTLNNQQILSQSEKITSGIKQQNDELEAQKRIREQLFAKILQANPDIDVNTPEGLERLRNLASKDELTQRVTRGRGISSNSARQAINPDDIVNGFSNAFSKLKNGGIERSISSFSVYLTRRMSHLFGPAGPMVSSIAVPFARTSSKIFGPALQGILDGFAPFIQKIGAVMKPLISIGLKLAPLVATVAKIATGIGAVYFIFDGLKKLPKLIEALIQDIIPKTVGFIGKQLVKLPQMLGELFVGAVKGAFDSVARILGFQTESSLAYGMEKYAKISKEATATTVKAYEAERKLKQQRDAANSAMEHSFAMENISIGKLTGESESSMSLKRAQEELNNLKRQTNIKFAAEEAVYDAYQEPKQKQESQSTIRIMQAIKDGWGEILAAFGTDWETFTETIIGFGELIKRYWEGVGVKIVDGIVASIKGASTAIATLIRGIRFTINAPLESWEFAKQTVGNISDYISAKISAIRDVIYTAFDYVKKPLDEFKSLPVIRQSIDFVSAGLNKLSEALHKLGEILKRILNTVGNLPGIKQAREFVGNAVGHVKDFAKATAVTIKSVFGGITKEATNMFASFIPGLRAVTQGIAEESRLAYQSRDVKALESQAIPDKVTATEKRTQLQNALQQKYQEQKEEESELSRLARRNQEIYTKQKNEHLSTDERKALTAERTENASRIRALESKRKARQTAIDNINKELEELGDAGFKMEELVAHLTEIADKQIEIIVQRQTSFWSDQRKKISKTLADAISASSSYEEQVNAYKSAHDELQKTLDERAFQRDLVLGSGTANPEQTKMFGLENGDLSYLTEPWANETDDAGNVIRKSGEALQEAIHERVKYIIATAKDVTDPERQKQTQEEVTALERLLGMWDSKDIVEEATKEAAENLRKATIDTPLVKLARSMQEESVKQREIVKQITKDYQKRVKEIVGRGDTQTAFAELSAERETLLDGYISQTESEIDGYRAEIAIHKQAIEQAKKSIEETGSNQTGIDINKEQETIRDLEQKIKQANDALKENAERLDTELLASYWNAWNSRMSDLALTATKASNAANNALREANRRIKQLEEAGNFNTEDMSGAFDNLQKATDKSFEAKRNELKQKLAEYNKQLKFLEENEPENADRRRQIETNIEATNNELSQIASQQADANAEIARRREEEWWKGHASEIRHRNVEIEKAVTEANRELDSAMRSVNNLANEPGFDKDAFTQAWERVFTAEQKQYEEARNQLIARQTDLTAELNRITDNGAKGYDQLDAENQKKYDDITSALNKTDNDLEDIDQKHEENKKSYGKQKIQALIDKIKNANKLSAEAQANLDIAMDEAKWGVDDANKKLSKGNISDKAFFDACFELRKANKERFRVAREGADALVKSLEETVAQLEAINDPESAAELDQAKAELAKAKHSQAQLNRDEQSEEEKIKQLESQRALNKLSVRASKLALETSNELYKADSNVQEAQRKLQEIENKSLTVDNTEFKNAMITLGKAVEEQFDAREKAARSEVDMAQARLKTLREQGADESQIIDQKRAVQEAEQKLSDVQRDRSFAEDERNQRILDRQKRSQNLQLEIEKWKEEVALEEAKTSEERLAIYKKQYDRLVQMESLVPDQSEEWLQYEKERYALAKRIEEEQKNSNPEDYTTVGKDWAQTVSSPIKALIAGSTEASSIQNRVYANYQRNVENHTRMTAENTATTADILKRMDNRQEQGFDLVG